MQLTLAQVESWLDSNPDLCQDYVIRKVSLNVINLWLTSRGYDVVDDVLATSTDVVDDVAATSTDVTVTSTDVVDDVTLVAKPKHPPQPSHPKTRCHSSPSRTRTQEGSAGGVGSVGESGVSWRRSSLKQMRRYTSLPPNTSSLLSLLTQSRVRLPVSTECPSRASKRDLLREIGERDYFLEAVREVSTELDPRTLRSKAEENMAILVGAQAAQLTLGVLGKEGVMGHVSQCGDIVSLWDVCQDPRFDPRVDSISGHRTRSLLCLPLRGVSDDVMGVAMVINKEAGGFTREDVKVLETYLQFVGIAITNAQVMEASRKEFERNRDLLQVAADLFEQTSMDQVLLRVMDKAKRLLRCESACVFLLEGSGERVRVSRSVQLGPGVAHCSERPCEDSNPRSQYLLRLAVRVADSGDVINVADCREGEGSVTSVLCMPVRNRQCHIIGVATVTNKLEGLAFDDSDERLFEAFTIFCGLGIHNSVMYGDLERAMARLRVAFEVLSYHTTTTSREVELMMAHPRPSPDWAGLRALAFDDSTLSEDDTVCAAAAMLGELGEAVLGCDTQTVYRFVMTVKRNYRDVPYHNWRHAFNVAQVMYAIMVGCGLRTWFPALDVLAMYVGCLCHDLDHRGTNNAFQQRTGSALAVLYGSTNTMEHHHFNHAVMILNSESHNILSGLSADSYSRVMQVLKSCILATDLSVYFERRDAFFQRVGSQPPQWDDDDPRRLLQAMLMTAADLGSACKPWPVQYRVAGLLAAEARDQRAREQELHVQGHVAAGGDHLPRLQVAWITDVCLPLYQALATVNPRLQELADGALDNIAKWTALAEEEGVKGDDP